MIKGIKFVSVPVTDQARAVAFYTGKLGFRIMTDQPFNDKQRWIELALPGSETRLVPWIGDGQGNQPGAFTGISLWTDDVEGTYSDLAASGVEFLSPPQKQQWGTFAILKDPDGNQFVLGTK